MTIIHIVIGIVMLFILYGIAMHSNTLYCLVHEKEEVHIYSELNKLPISSFKKTVCGYFNAAFEIENTTWIVILDSSTRLAWVTDGPTSECVACGFYKRGGRKLYQKLSNLK